MNDMNEEDLHEFISRFPLTEMQKTMLEKRLSGMTWEEIAAGRDSGREKSFPLRNLWIYAAYQKNFYGQPGF